MCCEWIEKYDNRNRHFDFQLKFFIIYLYLWHSVLLEYFELTKIFHLMPKTRLYATLSFKYEDMGCLTFDSTSRYLLGNVYFLSRAIYPYISDTLDIDSVFFKCEFWSFFAIKCQEWISLYWWISILLRDRYLFFIGFFHLCSFHFHSQWNSLDILL